MGVLRPLSEILLLWIIRDPEGAIDSQPIEI